MINYAEGGDLQKHEELWCHQVVFRFDPGGSSKTGDSVAAGASVTPSVHVYFLSIFYVFLYLETFTFMFL